MMHDFLATHRDDLIARCKAKVAQRPQRGASAEQIASGIPLFLDQLTRTLRAEDAGHGAASLLISGSSIRGAMATSEIGLGASAHGKALLALGYSVDQVVHDYGDLCQAITELALEQDRPIAVREFRTLNRCLDNAIADAVAGFSLQRETALEERLSSRANERLGFLVHELRNLLQMATLSARALDVGGLTLVGATGAVLKRSLAQMCGLVDSSIDEVRAGNPVRPTTRRFSLAALVEDAKSAAELGAGARDCLLRVAPVDPALRVEGDRELLLGALANLLGNAFKFTHPHTEVKLNAFARGKRVLIEVEDECGGLAGNEAERIFAPFSQSRDDRTGRGRGRPIARRSGESMGGTLTVRSRPGFGCVFTIELPDRTVEDPA